MAARPPESIAAGLLQRKAAADATRASAIAAADLEHQERLAAIARAHGEALAALADDALALVATAYQLDERPPVRERKVRRKAAPATLLPADRVEELLTLTIPALKPALVGLGVNELRQVRVAAEAREMAGHVATLDAAIKAAA